MISTPTLFGASLLADAPSGVVVFAQVGGAREGDAIDARALTAVRFEPLGEERLRRARVRELGFVRRPAPDEEDDGGGSGNEHARAERDANDDAARSTITARQPLSDGRVEIALRDRLRIGSVLHRAKEIGGRVLLRGIVERLAEPLAFADFLFARRSVGIVDGTHWGSSFSRALRNAAVAR